MTSEVKTYGIAHTDKRLIDFMVRSSIDLLKKSGVLLQEIKALDPFTGDGVFLGSLLSHGVGYISAYEIRREQYTKTSDIYGDCVNIHCVDAFKMRPQNFNLFIGNPPYGKCTKDTEIDKRIRESYGGGAVNQRSLYDGYVRAIRWASDNLKCGVIAYIVNNSFLDSITFANFRKRVELEFKSIHIVNLRGNHRTSGEVCKKEGGNVFANECRTGIAIIFLEKNNNMNNAPTVYDIRQSETAWQSLSCIGSEKGLKG